jgi:hypothetical protein
MGGLLRNIPLVGGTLSSNVAAGDPRYTYDLTPQQLEKAWDQVKSRFRECPTCSRVVCLSDWDEQSGYCNEDSPRQAEIAQAEAEQAGAVLKGFASAFGLGEVFKQATSAPQRRHAGGRRHQVLPAVWHSHGPACGRCLPQLRQGDARRQVLSGMRDQDRKKAGWRLP